MEIHNLGDGPLVPVQFLCSVSNPPEKQRCGQILEMREGLQGSLRDTEQQPLTVHIPKKRLISFFYNN
jgi:hypothetical protein